MKRKYMQATLIYNPNAGTTAQLSPDKLLDGLKEAGYDPIYAPTLQESDLDDALADAKDLVVVAGGDGFIRAVAIRLLGKGVRLAPLPLRTANNICRMLGLNEKPLEILAGLAEPDERDINIWLVITPHGPITSSRRWGLAYLRTSWKITGPRREKAFAD
jgi:diacylglycerol kinase (ATP)